MVKVTLNHAGFGIIGSEPEVLPPQYKYKHSPTQEPRHFIL